MERIYRELKDETKKKISSTLKGKSKTVTHRNNISNSMKNYWKNIPSRDKNNFTSTGRIV